MRNWNINRRSLLAAGGAGILGLSDSESVLSWQGNAEEVGGSTARTGLQPLNRFPRMVQEWLVDRVRDAEDRGDALRAAVRTNEDALDYVASCRERIKKCFGPFPEKTPLNARTTRVIERDTYRIENVIFESRPGYFVTANLYVPTKTKKPMPGVVGTCGHSLNGKANESYQSFAQGLARLGTVVFILDPVGQGERFQYMTPDLKSRYKGGVGEHIQMGNQQVLIGEFLGSWFAWDGVRALDYLLTREEVDPNHVGVTGNSGGGTQTAWLCGVDQRWTMAAPACFITTFRRNAENELPADTEQCPPRVLSLGLDHSDFLAALAPKPIVILAKERDYFDVRGASEAFQRLKTLYTVLGKPDNIELFVGPTYHGYTKENRVAMYQFFNKQTGNLSGTAKPTLVTEPTIVLEKDETLWCTPRGTINDLGSRTVFFSTRETSKSLAIARGQVRGEVLRRAASELLMLPAGNLPTPEYRILRGLGNRKYPTKGSCTYAVETEPGIHAIVTRLFDEPLLSRPPRGQTRASLYVSHRSADVELREESLVEQLRSSDPDAAFYACDVRGIGESQPDTCGVNTFLDPYGSDYFLAAHGLMLDRPVLGQRTFDVLRVIDWLVGQGHSEIHLAGNGWGALSAAFAALLSSAVKQVTLKHALRSFSELAQVEDYHWPFAALLPDVLKRFDLPDIYRELQAKQINNIEPWGATEGAS